MRPLAGLARIQPSEVCRARRSHMVLFLPQVEGWTRWCILGTGPGVTESKKD